jgi:hypothetical protein
VDPAVLTQPLKDHLLTGAESTVAEVPLSGRSQRVRFCPPEPITHRLIAERHSGAADRRFSGDVVQTCGGKNGESGIEVALGASSISAKRSSRQ